MIKGLNKTCSLAVGKRVFSGVLLFLLLFTDIVSILLYQGESYTASAAEVTIDSTVDTTADSHNFMDTQSVFISDQVGYKFYRDASGECVYSKTTDGGDSWSFGKIVDDRGARTDCIRINVHYDQWTPGDSGDFIHITTMDINPDEVWYNRLDTTDDSLLTGATAISAAVNSGQSPTYSVGANHSSITKGTDGTLYIAAADAQDSFVVECSSNCGQTTSWTETGTAPQDLQNDRNILMPLPDGDILIIVRDLSANDVLSKVWDDSLGTWDGSWATVDSSAAENNTWDGSMSAVVASSTGDIYLAYAADNSTPGSNDDIRTAIYSGGSWDTSTADVITNDSKGLTGAAIFLDQNTEDIYVAYTAQATAGTLTTGNVYWKKSEDSMSSWGGEQGPVNSSSDDIYGIDLNKQSNERVYVSWVETTASDLKGDTIADIFAGITASTTGSQTLSVDASTTDFYVGGSFSMTENTEDRDVTSITIKETGTIDAENDITNIKLYYENDTSDPYNCESEDYAGTESQYGVTDINGFSGANGTAAFSDTGIGVGTTSALCIYAVMDIKKSAADQSTINVTIANPSTDIAVTNGGSVRPATEVDIQASTTVYDSVITQTHYHWRLDDGGETDASSATGGVEDTPIPALQQEIPRRVRFGVSNEGSTTSPSVQYRIEYGLLDTACTDIASWTDVGGAGGDWDMYDSDNFTDGDDTTNIAEGDGGVTDENTSFVGDNNGMKDTSSETTGIVATSTDHFDLEYSIVASTTATEGNSYCFRLSNAGTALDSYSEYARVTISADVTVSASGTQIASTDIPTPDFYVGGTFVIKENISSRNVTDITIYENGTVDGAADISNVRLYYESDTSDPYNCDSESYGGSELQYGSTDSDGFSSANGTSTFSQSVAISTTSALCIYPVVDIDASATNGETLDIFISNPSMDVEVTGGGSVAPTAAVDITSSTTLSGPELTQTHYHWRNDDGDKTDGPGGASSATGGTEDTPLDEPNRTLPFRVRLQVSNEGATTSAEKAFTLEYGVKISSCSAISLWTDVDDSGGDWDMYNTINLTNGDDTTDIGESNGGVTNENTNFISPNGAILDTISRSATTTIDETEYLELEYSIEQTLTTGYETDYCFRLTQSGEELEAYNQYAELTTAPKRDFKIQRDTETITGASITLTAGVDYTAPLASTSAFIRITNSHYTGAGDAFGGGNQNADDVTAYIQDASNIQSSVTIARTAAVNDTRVSWEIVEYVGDTGADNEMFVRAQGPITYGSGALTATSGVVSGIADDRDIVVFITGQINPDTGRGNYHYGQSISRWSSTTNEAVFERGESGNAAGLSYAVVEFTGQNWNIQRVEHEFMRNDITETESITAVNNLSRTFLHTQRKVGVGLAGLDEFGHTVWLSSIGAVSFRIEPTAGTSTDSLSVAWVIENTQTSDGEMVVTRSSGSSSGGAEPSTFSIPIGATVLATNNTSIHFNSRVTGTGTAYPRPIAGATLASTTHYEFWRSDTGNTFTYRTEIIEWPIAQLAFRQNYYQFFVDNNELTPSDPWPEGVDDLGENFAITLSDSPVKEGDVVRIRASIRISNSTLSAGALSLKLQYGVRDTTCTAISLWTDVGAAGSGVVWRGYNATGTTDGTVLSGDPPTVGDLKISMSDRAGSLEEENNSTVNQYSVLAGEDIEYDWMIEHNSALDETFYCFRMVESDGSLLDGYNNYPTLLTAGYHPETHNWRWYDDEGSVTPSVALADENVAPIDVENQNVIKLRVTVAETNGAIGTSTKFAVQYSEYANFSQDVHFLTASSSCTATSTWCYADGGGDDNATITAKVLSDADACTGGVGTGCGTHNEASSTPSTFEHEANTDTEFEFTLKSAGPRVNRTYYFRLFDTNTESPVDLGSGNSYPSLVTEGASLVFTMSGVASSTVTEGVTTDISTTPVSIQFGSLPLDTEREGAHRLTVDTNGTEGYQVLMSATGDFVTAGGSEIEPVTGTNATPIGWSVGCSVSAEGCFGYHSGDDVLEGGSTRFSAVDTYARLSTTTPEEVLYSTAPVQGETVDIIYKVLVRDLQEAGQYETGIRYIAIPVF